MILKNLLANNLFIVYIINKFFTVFEYKKYKQ